MAIFAPEGTVELGECSSGRDIAKSSRCEYIISPFSVFSCSVSHLRTRMRWNTLQYFLVHIKL